MATKPFSLLRVLGLAAPYYIGIGVGIAFYIPTSRAYALLPSDPQIAIGYLCIGIYSIFVGFLAAASALFGVLSFRKPFLIGRRYLFIFLCALFAILTVYLFQLKVGQA
ncbi:MAG: hypothetical protein EBY32_18115 [Proteobacteria bacterium]|nr:hypothetical protein [Pseudomonadota bacterium]